MPAARCKYYWFNGNPIHRGCRAANCKFVHPEEKEWKSLPPYKAMVRCKHFDNNRRPVPGPPCIDGSKHCRFVHPDDPRWTQAEPTSRVSGNRRAGPSETRIKPAIRRADSSASSSKIPIQDTADALLPRIEPAILPPRRADSSASSSKIPMQDTADALLPKPQTTLQQARSENLASPPIPVEIPPKREAAPTSANVPAQHLLLQRLSESTSVESPSLRISPSGSISSPLGPLSTFSQTSDSSKRLAWKKLISLITQAVNLRKQLQDVNRRISLYSVDYAFITPSDKAQRSELLGASQDSVKSLEERLNNIITQLVELDFWPLPSDIKVKTQQEQDVHLDDYERLSRRLDDVEVQLKAHAKIRLLPDKKTNFSIDNVDIVEPSPRSLKRRRISLDGSFMPDPDVKELMDRLDHTESKMSDIWEGYVWDSDQIDEMVQELWEKTIQQNTFLPAHPNEGPRDLREKKVSSVEPEPVEVLIRNLESEFIALCEELAGHVPAVGKLEAEFVQLRLDSADLKQTTAPLVSSCEQLREQLELLSRQTQDISSEIANRDHGPDSQPSFAENRDYLIRTVGQDIKQHIATVRDDLTNLIASNFRDAQSAVGTHSRSGS